MKLHFNRLGVEHLLAHAEKAEPAKRRRAFGQRGVPAAALWLAGDDGVYLMSNGTPPLLATDVPPLPGQLPRLAETVTEKRDALYVVYAKECDPTRMSFESWWDAKQQSFGGDDGVEQFKVSDIRGALATYRPTEDLILDVTPAQMGIVTFETQRCRPAPGLRLAEAQALPDFKLRPSHVQRHCGSKSPLRRIVGVGKLGVIGRWALLDCGHWREIRDYDLQPALGRKIPRRAACGCCRLNYQPEALDKAHAEMLIRQLDGDAPEISGPDYSGLTWEGSRHVQ